MQTIFKHRTAFGLQTTSLLVEAKQFEIMKHPAFDAVISKYWQGVSDFSVHLLDGSATFALVSRTPFAQMQDYERGIRNKSLKFTRESL